MQTFQKLLRKGPSRHRCHAASTKTTAKMATESCSSLKASRLSFKKFDHITHASQLGARSGSFSHASDFQPESYAQPAKKQISGMLRRFGLGHVRGSGRPNSGAQVGHTDVFWDICGQWEAECMFTQMCFGTLRGSGRPNSVGAEGKGTGCLRRCVWGPLRCSGSPNSGCGWLEYATVATVCFVVVLGIGSVQALSWLLVWWLPVDADFRVFQVV